MNDAPTISRVRKADSVDHTPASKLRVLPRRLVTQAAHRVGTAALTWGGTYVAAIGVNEYAAHTIGQLPAHGWNLGHTVAILFVAVSLGLFVVSRSERLAPEQLLDLGLVYEVLGGFAIVVGTSAGMVWDGRAHILQDKHVPSYVTILRIHGPFLFGTTGKLMDATADLSAFAPIVVLRLRHMTAIDATGLHALEGLNDRLRRSGRTLLLCGARTQPAELLRQVEFVHHVGARNILPHVDAALKRAEEIWSGFGGVGDDAARDLAAASL